MQTRINKHIEYGFKTEINAESGGEGGDLFPFYLGYGSGLRKSIHDN